MPTGFAGLSNALTGGHAASLGDPRVPAGVRRGIAAHLGSTYGNAYLQRAISKVAPARAAGPVLARSPLSDELGQLWANSGKGAFFARLRSTHAPGAPDPDVKEFIDVKLRGDDQWLALNILQHGPEAGWPIDLRVRREMKGWGDSGGKGAVFEILRVANAAEAGNGALSTAIQDVFAPGSDDLWLAQSLQLHGREASWPIHLRVRREMKGWADSGGKGAVFEILRVANAAEAGNGALSTAIQDVFAPGSDDLWLAQSLQLHGREASWPIHLRVRREMKGWADSGGKGVVFEMLRATNGSEAANAELTTAINDVFGAGTDDRWLAENLQLHGREASWPIHLRVQREMKGWGDSGGKGAVFDLLRADNGAHAGDPALGAAINGVFAAGTEDQKLARNLMLFGPEASWPAPVPHAPGLIPFDHTPKSSPAERIIFNCPFDLPGGEEYHEMVFTASQGAFDIATGGSVKTVSGLDSGNVDFFLPATWTGSSPITVMLQVRTRSSVQAVLFADTWTFSLKTNPPTTIQQLDAAGSPGGEGEVALGTTYTYEVGPDLTPGVPDYEHQTILERFEQPTCNITVNELTPAFRASHPHLTTPEQINEHFFGGAGSNGTFAVDNLDRIYDIHSGGVPNPSTLHSALVTVKEVHSDLPQVYESQPGVVLGRYLIRRIVKSDGSFALRKMRQP